MSKNLREALRHLLDGWRADLTKPWQSVFEGVEPAFDAVAADLDLAGGEAIFPGRRGRAPSGARSDSHMFRAMDGVPPADVAVVVVGQDPFTKVSQATGRSFEQGDLKDWLGVPKVTPSLRRMIQALAAMRTGNANYVQGSGAWQSLVNDLSGKELDVEPPHELWDAWQKQGVIFINAIWTFNRFKPRHQFEGHGRLWAPIVRALFDFLVRRTGRSVVFVTWGGKAQALFSASGARAAAEQAGTWDKSVAQVKRPHPNAPGDDPPFLQQGNPFDEINDALVRVGGQRVRW